MSRREQKERKYHCLKCLDEGIVIVFSAYFVRDYREQFNRDCETMGAAGFYQRAHKFWRFESDWPHLGPLNHSAICVCDCPRRNVLANTLELYRKPPVDKNNNPVKVHRPAAGTHWRPDLQPLWPNSIDGDLWASLSEFYAAQPALF